METPAYHILGHCPPLINWLQAGLQRLNYPTTGTPEAAEVLIVSGFVAKTGQRLRGDDPATETLIPWLSGLPTLSRCRQLILLSSASVYGEGDFRCGDCGLFPGHYRLAAHLDAKRWEALCPICGDMLVPLPLKETSPALPLSPWGESALGLEETIAQLTLPFPVITLRLFHPYWPTSDFLTGMAPGHVVARLTQDLLADKPPFIYEDGYGMRDWTHGEDVIQALDQVIRTAPKMSGTYNIASGSRLTIQELAAYLQEFFEKTDVPYTLSEHHRPGDVRHRLADITQAQAVLNYQPQFDSVTGLAAFAKELQLSLTNR